MRYLAYRGGEGKQGACFVEIDVASVETAVFSGTVEGYGDAVLAVVSMHDSAVTVAPRNYVLDEVGIPMNVHRSNVVFFGAGT